MVQLRKNCNHPDLLESVFDESCISLILQSFMLKMIYTISLNPYFFFLTVTYPPVEQIVEQCGKFRLLDRLLTRLFACKHKVNWFVNLVQSFFSVLPSAPNCLLCISIRSLSSLNGLRFWISWSTILVRRDLKFAE